MSNEPRKSLARNLGEFVGHIVRAVRRDSSADSVRRRKVEARTEGRVLVRRTTVEEIVLDADADAPPPPRS